MGGTGVVHYLNVYGEAGSDGGDVPLAGVIAVHPSLSDDGHGPMGKIDIPSLFLTGGADFLTGPQAMAKLEEDMMMGSSDDGDVDSSTPWETVRYAKIGHAFSNWLSEGSYDERADARSWHSMTTFLEKEFGLIEYETDVPDEQVEVVNYTDGMDGNHPLTGYVSLPEGMTEGELLPVVIILPHDMSIYGGPGQYEQQRATQVARDTGYIGFVADIYTHDLFDFDCEASEVEELYHSNITKYLSRIHAAVDHVKTMEGVDGDKIAVIGFGFGGSGALYYALSGEEVDGSVKAIASFHGELAHVANATADMTAAAAPSDGSAWDSGTTGGGGDSAWDSETTDGDSAWVTEDVSPTWNNDPTTRRRMSDSTQPQILIQSGANGDAMEDVIQLEQTLIGMGANYELTRFSDTKDKFTISWDDNYNPRASLRSFDQLYTVLNEVFSDTASDDGTDSPEVASTGAPIAAPITKSTESPIASTVESTESPVVAPITKSTESPVAAPLILIELRFPTTAPTDVRTESPRTPTDQPSSDFSASSFVATSSAAGLVFATLTMGLLLL